MTVCLCAQPALSPSHRPSSSAAQHAAKPGGRVPGTRPVGRWKNEPPIVTGSESPQRTGADEAGDGIQRSTNATSTMVIQRLTYSIPAAHQANSSQPRQPARVVPPKGHLRWMGCTAGPAPQRPPQFYGRFTVDCAARISVPTSRRVLYHPTVQHFPRGDASP